MKKNVYNSDTENRNKVFIQAVTFSQGVNYTLEVIDQGYNAYSLFLTPQPAHTNMQ